MFELAKRFIETEYARQAKRSKDDPQRIELAASTEISEGNDGQIHSPEAPFRPVQQNCPLTEPAENLFRDIYLPDRAVGMDEEHILTARTPPTPDDNHEQQPQQAIAYHAHDDERQQK
jgi:hypothetical protein